MNNQKYNLLLRKSNNAPLEPITIIGDLLEEAYKLIDCSHITAIPLRSDVSVLIDEEIMLKNGYENKTNFWYDSIFTNGNFTPILNPQWIFGDVIFVGIDKNNNFTSLNSEQKEFINKYLFD